jgi:hypothetical protein
MRKIIFIITVVVLFAGCKKEKVDPGFTYAKTVELYFDQAIPEGCKLYIDDIVLTSKTFYDAGDSDDKRYDYTNKLISTTEIWENGVKNTNLTTGRTYAGRSLVYFLYNETGKYSTMATVSGKPQYIYMRISAKADKLKIKTENYPVQITVIK